MKEERMAILKMIDDGKINPDDAVKLLNAMAGSKKGFDGAELQAGFEDKVKAFAKNMDTMSKELGKKLEEVGKDVEPTVKKVAQTIIDKTSECVDEISKAFKKDDGDCRCDEDGENTGCCCNEGGESGDAPCCCDDAPKEN